MEVSDLFDDAHYGDWYNAFLVAGALDKRNEIEAILWTDVVNGDIAETTIRAMFRLKNGRGAFLEAWCDTTGWDCQADGTWIEFDTAEDMLAHDAALRLGYDGKRQ